MIYEGADQPDLLEAGLAVARAIHDRYDAQLRNPYNEVECSDHYARAKASFGTFLAACGYEYHGPQGRLGFAPRISPDTIVASAGCVTDAKWSEGGRGHAITVEFRRGHTKSLPDQLFPLSRLV